MKKTEKKAYSMALRLCRNSLEAQDLTQDSYIKAWRAFDTYALGRPFINWLLRIMQRTHLDNLRRENPVRNANSINSMVSPSDGEIQEIPIEDSSFDPAKYLDQKNYLIELKQTLEELPDVYRRAIVMCDVDGLSYQDIAECEQTTIGTIRSRIHRGRKLLRTLMDQNPILKFSPYN